VSLHREILGVARGVLDGTVGIVEAARILVSISFALGVEDEEPFLTFRSIDSETDHYPLGDVRARWSPNALAREDGKRERYEAKIRAGVEEACRGLIAKYESLASDNALEQTRDG
jgi:hypothetical protein